MERDRDNHQNRQREKMVRQTLQEEVPVAVARNGMGLTPNSWKQSPVGRRREDRSLASSPHSYPAAPSCLPSRDGEIEASQQAAGVLWAPRCATRSLRTCVTRLKMETGRTFFFFL